MDANRHMCLIYEKEPSSHLAILAPTLAQRLLLKERCIFLGSPPVVRRARTSLEQCGVDVGHHEEQGSLILSSVQDGIVNGRFEIEAMLGALEKAIDLARQDGYMGLYATGDMTWEFGGEKDLDKLLAYEFSLEQLFQRRQTLGGICLYHKETLPLHTLGDALLTHPSFYINHTLHRANKFYVPPEMSAKQTPAPVTDEAAAPMLNAFTGWYSKA